MALVVRILRAALGALLSVFQGLIKAVNPLIGPTVNLSFLAANPPKPVSVNAVIGSMRMSSQTDQPQLNLVEISMHGIQPERLIPAKVYSGSAIPTSDE
jgi:hypothetical protein